MSSTAALYYNFERWATTTTKGGGRQKIEILFRNERHFPSLPQHIHTPRKKTLWQKLKFQGDSFSSLLKIETKNKLKKKQKNNNSLCHANVEFSFTKLGIDPLEMVKGAGGRQTRPHRTQRLDWTRNFSERAKTLPFITSRRYRRRRKVFFFFSFFYFYLPLLLVIFLLRRAPE